MGNECICKKENLEFEILNESPIRKKFLEFDEFIKNIKELRVFERAIIAENKYNDYIKYHIEKENLNDEEIKKEYIQIMELLLYNDTNKKIVILYLNFIKKNHKFVSTYKLNSYSKELFKYQRLFTVEEMKNIQPGYKEISEKEKFINYLKNLSKSNNIKEISQKAENESKTFRHFNLPIEFSNQELFYYKLYILLIFDIYNNFKENPSFFEKYINHRISIAKLVVNSNILNNQKIINNEDKMNILITLIIFDTLDENKESVNFNRLLQIDKITYNELDKYVKYNSLGDLIQDKNELQLERNKGDIRQNIKIELDSVCLKNLKNEELSIFSSKYIYNTLDSLLNKNDLTDYIESIKLFLLKIIYSNVYTEAIKILFPDDYNYLLGNNIKDMEIIIKNRFKFYPYQDLNNSGLTDKLSCYSYIPIISSSVILPYIFYPLKISATIENSIHEINHINQDLLYFKGNNTKLFNTPKRNNQKLFILLMKKIMI